MEEGANKLFTHKGFVLQKKSFYMLIAEGMTDFIGTARKEKKRSEGGLQTFRKWMARNAEQSLTLPSKKSATAFLRMPFFPAFLFFKLTEASE